HRARGDGPRSTRPLAGAGRDRTTLCGHPPALRRRARIGRWRRLTLGRGELGAPITRRVRTRCCYVEACVRTVSCRREAPGAPAREAGLATSWRRGQKVELRDLTGTRVGPHGFETDWRQEISS